MLAGRVFSCRKALTASKRPALRILRATARTADTLPSVCTGSSLRWAHAARVESRPSDIITPTVIESVYEPPKTGLISLLPKSVIPYAELSRLDKPAGSVYLFFPCLFSTLLAATVATPVASPTEVLSYSALFLSGALIMRGAGCTINDLWDRNLDPHVTRTRFRPIARRAITPQAAIVYTSAQLLAGLAVLVQFPTQCLYYGIPSLALVTTYPLAKRVTNYPQFVLGLTFSWGALMGFPALGVDLMANHDALVAGGLLYSSCVAWTVLYDMIYAHMDIKDDAKAGIKSIALRHEKNTKAVLTGLGVVQLGLLAAAGTAAGAGPIFFVGSCGGAAATLATMIWKVNLKSVPSCWWWFRNGCYMTGGKVVPKMTCVQKAHGKFQLLRARRIPNKPPQTKRFSAQSSVRFYNTVSQPD
ncbi:hypothetical protein FH972_026363 [Carpinus fangiana]|uniref:4-hydroxybenzoate polyprenyltransferase, mitochondrial n=1 Tax=Carpinus fangiana TaxID=176857 RepID=A0A5N6L447_9ROSI|nr:hypothetical protein FH972_026363 [Carpinus fangiana]